MAFAIVSRGTAMAAGTARLSTCSARFGSSLVFGKHGSPAMVLRLEDTPTPSPSKGQVVVKILAAPVSLSDIDHILGCTPGSQPGVGGCGGVGVVEAVSSGSSLAVGDHVVPNSLTFGGTWRSHAVVSEDVIDKIPSSLPPQVGATFSSFCIAFRLLNDFVSLKKGDFIIQNDAGSEVGEAVVQLAAARGVKTFNVAKKEHVDRLKKLGGTVVVDEDTLRSSPKYYKNGAEKAKLALNGAGGSSATEISRLLSHGGTFVTYGNSSRKHLKITPSALILNDVSFRGFDLEKWRNTHTKEQREEMVKEVSVAMGQAKVSSDVVGFGEWEKALEKAKSGGSVVMKM
mmetsp:Transcript_18355/g.28744  ORF Transcript_18355/g.28744 Transcript_18355/m.28744 type:complete len:343 (-) Transcript_18355:225-1253(-)